MAWQDHGWQRWEQDAPWPEPGKGKGKGKGFGKPSRPSLALALEKLQGAIAEQAALSVLAGVLPQRHGAGWQPTEPTVANGYSSAPLLAQQHPAPLGPWHPQGYP